VSSIRHVETSTPNIRSRAWCWEISTKSTSIVRFCIPRIFRDGIQTDSEGNHEITMPRQWIFMEKKLALSVTLVFVRCPLRTSSRTPIILSCLMYFPLFIEVSSGLPSKLITINYNPVTKLCACSRALATGSIVQWAAQQRVACSLSTSQQTDERISGPFSSLPGKILQERGRYNIRNYVEGGNHGRSETRFTLRRGAGNELRLVSRFPGFTRSSFW
jgi:hypothetical protein